MFLMAGAKLRVLVCGSRDWPSHAPIWKRLDELLSTAEGGIAVIEGGAPGADNLAAAWSERVGCDHTTVRADWMAHGRAAGPIRNRQMLDLEPDLVLAFQCGDSPGTQDTIDEARRRGIPVEITTLATAGRRNG
jgi:hypothetical protein